MPLTSVCTCRTLFSALQAEAAGAVAGMKADKSDKGVEKKKSSSSYKL